MQLLLLAWKSARARTATTILTVASIALSTALLIGVEKIRAGARSGFEQTVSGTDLIVGARSGPVNLLLYSIFRLGDPTANISWDAYETFAGQPAVRWTVPLSLGDSHGGFRVLGTTTAYFDHYRYGEKRTLDLVRGDRFGEPFDAVLGADVARSLGYDLGDQFHISHGIQSAGFAEHKQRLFTVTGVLSPTGTPVDRTIHISLAGLEAVHQGWGGTVQTQPGRGASMADEASPGALQPRAITAFLVGLKTKSAVLSYRRRVNTYRPEALTAIIPGVALARLWRIVGSAEQALRAIAVFVVVAVLIGLLTTILSSLNERRREIAIFRAVGAGARDIFFLLTLESTLVAALGAMTGMAAINGGLLVAGRLIEQAVGIPLGNLGLSSHDLLVVGGVSVMGLVLGLVPGWLAYRRSLSDGLTVKI